MPLPIQIRVVQSHYFLNRARESCLNPPPIKKEDEKFKTKDNYYSSSFFDAYIMSTTALEAFINERIAMYLEFVKYRIAAKDANDVDKNNKKIVEILGKEELVSKYRLIPIILWRKYFDESRAPFQDFKTLVSIRNDIIHYKMPLYEKNSEKPKWAKKFEEK